MKKIPSNNNIILDNNDALHIGFSTPKTLYTIPIFNSQLIHKSSILIKVQGLKHLINKSFS